MVNVKLELYKLNLLPVLRLLPSVIPDIDFNLYLTFMVVVMRTSEAATFSLLWNLTWVLDFSRWRQQYSFSVEDAWSINLVETIFKSFQDKLHSLSSDVYVVGLEDSFRIAAITSLN